MRNIHMRVLITMQPFQSEDRPEINVTRHLAKKERTGERARLGIVQFKIKKAKRLGCSVYARTHTNKIMGKQVILIYSQTIAIVTFSIVLRHYLC